MKKQTQTLIFKAFPFLRKNQQQKHTRNYNTLVKNFKSRIQTD